MGIWGRSPELRTALVCRRILCDVTTGEHSLIDIVLALTAPALPFVDQLQVYVCLTGVAERLRLRVEIGQEATQIIVFRGDLVVDSPDGTFPYQRVLAVASPSFMVTFTEAGNYYLRVYQAERLLGATPLLVAQSP